MYWLCYILIVSSCVIYVHSFVLLQVRKQNESVSKIDALIHKVLPNDKVLELKNRFAQRAVRTGNFDKKSVRKTVDSKPFVPKAQTQKVRKLNKRKENVAKVIADERASLESVVLSGVKNMMAQENTTALVDNVSKKILDFVKKSAGPIFRAGGESLYNIKPEIIELENSSPSLMFKLDSKTVFNLISNLLSSDAVKDVVDHVAKGAGKAYRKVLDSVPEEIIYENMDRT